MEMAVLHNIPGSLDGTAQQHAEDHSKDLRERERKKETPDVRLDSCKIATKLTLFVVKCQVLTCL